MERVYESFFISLLLLVSAVGAFAESASTVQLTIIAEVPEGSGDVYLPGNLEMLGPWDPGLYKMEGNGTERRAVLNVEPGTEVLFKFTRGGWNNEMLTEDLKVPDDFRVVPVEDTVFRAVVPIFKSIDMAMPYEDPTRFEADIVAFETVDAAQMPPAGALLAVGSSSIRYWHDTIAEDLAPVPVIKRGFGGSTMHDLNYYFDRVVLPYKPAGILLYEGDNDIAANVPLAEVKSEFEQFFQRVAATLPNTTIFILPPKPSPSRADYWPRTQEFHAWLKTKCANNDKMIYLDTVPPMLDENGVVKSKYFLEDDLHMNPEGYVEWTKVVRPVLVRWWDRIGD